MVDIRPYRRLAVPFQSPSFKDLCDVSEFVSSNYEHFGVAKFTDEVFSYADVPTLRLMCSGVGLRLMFDCEDPSLAVRAAVSGADFVSVGHASAPFVASQAPGNCIILSAIETDMDLELVKVSPARGVLCGVPLVAASRRGLPPGSLVFCSGGDAVTAVKDGADYTTVGESTFRSHDPAEALRSLAEKYREFT